MALQGVPVGQIPPPPHEYSEADEGAFRDTVRQWLEEANAWMQQRTDDTDTVAGSDYMPATGRYFIPGLVSVAHSNNGIALTADRQYFIHFSPLRDVDIDQLAINVGVAVASSVARAGIYTDSGGEPDTLLVETADFDTSTTGAKTEVLGAAESLTAGTSYWASMVADAAISVLGEATRAEAKSLGQSDTTGATGAYTAQEDIGTWSAMPATAGTMVWGITHTNVFMRVG